MHFKLQCDSTYTQRLYLLLSIAFGIKILYVLGAIQQSEEKKSKWGFYCQKYIHSLCIPPFPVISDVLFLLRFMEFSDAVPDLSMKCFFKNCSWFYSKYSFKSWYVPSLYCPYVITVHNYSPALLRLFI